MGPSILVPKLFQKFVESAGDFTASHCSKWSQIVYFSPIFN